MGSHTAQTVQNTSGFATANIIRKEEIGDQSSSISVPEASIHILSTQNEDETNTLGQDEPNSAPATQHTSNQSPSPVTQCTSNQSPPANQRTANQLPAAAATQCTSNQSPTAATQCTADQSPAAVVTRRTTYFRSVIQIYCSSYSYPTQKYQEKQSLKLVSAIFYQTFIFSLIDSPSKTMKSAF